VNDIVDDSLRFTTFPMFAAVTPNRGVLIGTFSISPEVRSLTMMSAPGMSPSVPSRPASTIGPYTIA
jgi:hypothetical protein